MSPSFPQAFNHLGILVYKKPFLKASYSCFFVLSQCIITGLLPRHTDEMIHKLESAGLGYHVKTDQSEDRLGMTYLSMFHCVSVYLLLKRKHSSHAPYTNKR